MAKRTTRKPSVVFANVIKQAEAKLSLDAAAAENFLHKGLRGGERVAALAAFLQDHLPGIYQVGGGEIIDYSDNKSGEIDLFIYDRSTASPIQTSSASHLIPAEAVYAVIEVKTELTQDELNKCMSAGKKIRQLRPFKGVFISSPLDGSTYDEHVRCPYYIFSYRSNISKVDWAAKEYKRVALAAQSANCNVDIVDSICVLDRGIIRPGNKVALTVDGSSDVFLQFYIQIVNFLTRERRRRPAIDWAAYASKGKWRHLN